MKIHFIGIGGIGVSALAKYYLAKEHTVTGSDLAETEITHSLETLGAHLHLGPHRAENVPMDADMVVYSPAVQKDNPELLQAQHMQESESSEARLDLPKQKKVHFRALSYPEALGELTKEYFTVAISGTHGKSTTTSMIALILVKAGLDPTVIVGTKLKEFDTSNCRVGQGLYLHKGRPILVIEADEHFASFLNYSPDIIVLTTIEQDHLDYYQNLNNILRAFKGYVAKLPPDGVIVANKDDKNVGKVVTSSKRLIQYYSKGWIAPKQLRQILKVPGEFNVANAHAALTCARVLGVPDETSYAALGAFQGTWRRFEVFEVKTPVPYTVVSDYGHHPTEVKVTLEAARAKWPKLPLWLVFQPHQYQRTYYFFRDFINILSRLPIDKLILTDIYDVAGREQAEIKKKVSAHELALQIQKKKGRKYPDFVVYTPTLDKAQQWLEEHIAGGEVIMVMGAGDIYKVALALAKTA